SATGESETFAAPILVADAGNLAGGPEEVFDVVRSMIEAGAAGVVLSDRVRRETLAGGENASVLAPASAMTSALVAARLAADVLDVPAVLIARTEAGSGRVLEGEVGPEDQPFLSA